MTERENNIRHISQFLRDIQQLTEYSSNRNTFNVNINYYEKYYNGIDNNEDNRELYVEEPNRVNTERQSNEVPINRYYVEINGESEIPPLTPNALNQVNQSSVDSNNLMPSIIGQSNTEQTTEQAINPSSNILRREITIPFRTTTNLRDINSTFPVNLTNNLSDITNIINQALTENLSNINLDNLNIELGSLSNNTANLGMTLTELNTKTSLISYNTLSIDDRESKCHICNEDYNETDICRKNNSCGHYLHQTCLDNWYASHNTCPICNSPI
jgi:hypothetical protein